MTKQPTAPSAELTLCRIIGGTIAAIALCTVAACSSQPARTTSATAQNALTNPVVAWVEGTAAPVTNETTTAQVRLANTLSLPVEKTLPKSGIVLRLIPPGTFMMGSPHSEQEALIESFSTNARAEVRSVIEREKCHKVTLTKPFYIGTHEVTQGQWNKVMGSNQSNFKDVGDTAPVEKASWHACTNFLKKLALLEGMPEGSFSLPTEAQWEYACRAGTPTAFCYGSYPDATMENFNGNFSIGNVNIGEYRKKTMPVGQFKPNAWGLYDMHGNVWEWCADWYGAYPADTTDPIGPAEGVLRVIRGGSWISQPILCRSAARGNNYPIFENYSVGLRISMPAQR